MQEEVGKCEKSREAHAKGSCCLGKLLICDFNHNVFNYFKGENIEGVATQAVVAEPAGEKSAEADHLVFARPPVVPRRRRSLSSHKMRASARKN